LRARVAALATIVLLAAAAARTHPAPNSLLRLDFESRAVRAEYWLPVSELGHARAQESDADIAAYLLRRVGAESTSGAGWRIRVDAIREARYLDHDYLVADLHMAPPAGQDVRPFVLIDDAITHEVRNHIVFVVENRTGGNRLIGTLQYPERRLSVPEPKTKEHEIRTK
jgi:hypothetical protein